MFNAAIAAANVTSLPLLTLNGLGIYNRTPGSSGSARKFGIQLSAAGTLLLPGSIELHIVYGNSMFSYPITDDSFTFASGSIVNGLMSPLVLSGQYLDQESGHSGSHLSFSYYWKNLSFGILTTSITLNADY